MIQPIAMRAVIAAAGMISASALIAQTTTPAAPPIAPPASSPVAPAATTTAPDAAAPVTPPPAPANPFDQILTSARPLASSLTSHEYKVASAVTKDCVTALSLEGGTKLSIDLKTMQGMAVNTNLMIRGGGHVVQLEFDGKGGEKAAADAEKALGTLNDKCG